MILPTQQYEKELNDRGYNLIAGVDEAGRGAWAGPIVAAAVIMPKNETIEGIKDSKLLSPCKREELCCKIKKRAIAWSVGIVDIEFINQYNIGKANIKVFEEAIKNLRVKPDYFFIDGILKIKSEIKGESVKDGDAKVYSIAVASIIAKTARDNILIGEHKNYPCYGFDRHKGYGTKAHRDALEKYGICKIHRTLYKPIKGLLPNTSLS